MLMASFVGFSDSGKTTLLERLAAAWKARGRQVVAVKKGHNAPVLPDGGKDTSRLLAAGAAPVFLLAGGQLIRFQTAGDDPWVQIATELSGADVVLLEGLVVPGVPIIEVVRRDRPGLKLPAARLAAVVGDADPGAGVRFFAAEDLSSIMDFLEGWHGS